MGAPAVVAAAVPMYEYLAKSLHIQFKDVQFIVCKLLLNKSRTKGGGRTLSKWKYQWLTVHIFLKAQHLW